MREKKLYIHYEARYASIDFQEYLSSILLASFFVHANDNRSL